MFRNINTTTLVNFMEMVMSNEVSEICKQVRSRVKYYKEYNNSIHPLFSVSPSKSSQEITPDNWKSRSPNERRKWDEYVFIAMIKTLGGGNVDAGRQQIESLVETGTISKSVLATVDRFLDDALQFKNDRNLAFNTRDFAIFQLFWFGLYEKNKCFKITNTKLFKSAFMAAYSLYTGKNTELNNETIVYDGEICGVKEFVRSNSTNFSNGAVQKKCFELLYNEAKNCGLEDAIVFRDTKRSFSTEEREEKLSLQGYKCAIDGHPLNLEDSVWGHDISWADGGNTYDGAVIRKTHNDRMGQLTINQYKQVAV